ncbi:ATP-binding protein [Bacillus sp. SL00103]
MKIRSLHIAHFGKFSNRTFHFSDDGFQLVYGLNESGKTTLKTFIESMLFGFPKTRCTRRKGVLFMGGSLTVKMTITLFTLREHPTAVVKHKCFYRTVK